MRSTVPVAALCAWLLVVASGAPRVADFGTGGRAACVGTCTPACPCASLQQTLDAAADGDEVWLLPADGKATPIPCENARTDRAVTLRPHPHASAVTLDCGGVGRALWLDARGRAGSELPHALIANLTITRGRADTGGCVRADDVLLSVDGCTFIDCEATATAVDDGGGAVSVRLLRGRPSASLAVSRTAFRSCRSGADGGALLVSALGSMPEVNIAVSQCSFSDAVAQQHGGAVAVRLWGGGAPARRVAVTSSSFIRCASEQELGAGGALYLHLLGSASPRSAALVSGCSFVDTAAGWKGGAVLAVLEDTGCHACSASVEDSRFLRAHARQTGGGFEALVDAPGSAGVTVAVRRSVFVNCSTSENSGGAVYAAQWGNDCPHATIAIADSQFEGCRSHGFGGCVACMFRGRGANNSLLVLGSRFSGSMAGTYGGALAFFFTAPASSAAWATIVDSVFAANTAAFAGGAVMAWLSNNEGWGSGLEVSRCRFEGNVALRGHGGALQVDVLSRDAQEVRLRFSRTSFLRNFATRTGGAVDLALRGHGSTNAHVTLQECAFRGNEALGSGGAVHVDYFLTAHRGGSMAVHRCEFVDCHAGGSGGALYLSAPVTSPGSVVDFRAHVLECSFLRCSAREQGGAVFAALARQPQPVLPLYCSAQDVWEREWLSTALFTVRDSAFRSVAATGPRGMGGALAVAGGQLVLHNCSVTGATASFAGAAVHSSASAAVEAWDLVVVGAQAPVGSALQHEGAGALVLRNCSFAALSTAAAFGDGAVLVARAAAVPLQFEGSSLACAEGEVFHDDSTGEAVVAEQWPVSASDTCDVKPLELVDSIERMRSYNVLWRCQPCAAGTYYLSVAREAGGGAAEHGRCSRCPFGATCHGRHNVTANPGMWCAAVWEKEDDVHEESSNGSTRGAAAAPVLVLPPALIRCSDGYCCSGPATCLRFDSCAPTRTGVLCGNCEAGATSVLGSTRCRPAAQCGRVWQDTAFWPVSLAAVVAFVLWQLRLARRTVRSQQRMAAVLEERDAVQASGMMKALFAYYQCLPLLLVADGNTSALRHVTRALQQAFNLQLPAAGTGGAGVCPLVGLTPVSKELLGVALALAVLAALPAVQLIHAALSWFAPAAEVRLGSWRWRGIVVHPPQPHVYAAAFTSLAMLTYASLTTAAMRLVACVDVPGHGHRLLVQGSVLCWQREAWWQWVAVAWLACSTVLVPAALAYGGALLRRGAITPGAFWLSLFLPLPCMLRWLCQQRGADRAQVPAAQPSVVLVAASTRAALELAYRPTAWWWDSVLLLRRLLLAAFALFLHQQPVMQALAGALVVLGGLVLHVHHQPFASAAVNLLEVCFLSALALAAVLSMRAASLVSVTVTDATGWRNQVAAGLVVTITVAFPVAWLLLRSLRLLRRRLARTLHRRVWQQEQRLRQAQAKHLSGAVAMQALKQSLLQGEAGQA